MLSVYLSEAQILLSLRFLTEVVLQIIRAHKVDKAGNCVFRLATRAFGPLMGRAAKLTIVEAEYIVEIGEIDVCTLLL